MSNSQATPQRDGGPASSTSAARDEAIAQCIEVVVSLLPTHDIHTCCHRERRRLVAALEALRLMTPGTTHGKA